MAKKRAISKRVSKKKTVKRGSRKTKQHEDTLFDDDAKQQAIALLSMGCDVVTTRRFLRVPRKAWRNEHEENEEFAKDIEHAIAAAEVNHMRCVHRAASEAKNWRVSQWWLERTAPERYAPIAQRGLSVQELQGWVGKVASLVREEVGLPIERDRLVERLRDLSQRLQEDPLDMV